MLSKRPFSRLIVKRSVSVCVGWAWLPSPALMTGMPAYCEATNGAPSLKWRMAMMSAKQRITRTVSATVSPFDTDEELASEKPMTCPPSSSIAAVKLNRVRVEGS